jgi:2-polyprenyl-6-hydroxyphenyl methylase/3-demethylubiquinone-9 3-methyltransferase
MFAHHVDRRVSSTVTPNELEITIERSGLSVLDERGVVYHPLRNAWQPSTDVDVNHMVAAARN